MTEITLETDIGNDRSEEELEISIIIVQPEITLASLRSNQLSNIALDYESANHEVYNQESKPIYSQPALDHYAMTIIHQLDMALLSVNQHMIITIQPLQVVHHKIMLQQLSANWHKVTPCLVPVSQNTITLYIYMSGSCTPA